MIRTTNLGELRHANIVFNDRVLSLVNDGYHLMYRALDVANTLWFASLRHHNGNRIIIKAYPYENRLVQMTNDVVTHEGTLY